MRWRVGQARIDRVEEQTSLAPIALLTDDEDFIERALARLPETMFDARRRTFPLCFQSWIVSVAGLVVVVDPCNGNGRKRPGFAQFEDLDQPWLERFAATGVRPEDVDYVFCTHLHCDHCGWNTRTVDGRYVPTFPNATYLFAAREYARWDPSTIGDAAPRDPAEYNSFVFDEAVRPIMEAGLGQLIDPPFRVSPSLKIEHAIGHTLGHAILLLDTEEQPVCFSGDVLHHPAQILRPELHMPGCDDLGRAISTRQELLERLADMRAFIFPAHFGPPYHGQVSRDGAAFRFVAGGALIDTIEDPLR